MSLELQVSPAYLTHPDVRKWIEYHGIALKSVTREGQTGAFASIPLKCSKLTTDLKCSVHGTPEKPNLCNEWPFDPSNLVGLEDRCTFSFTPDLEGVPA